MYGYEERIITRKLEEMNARINTTPTDGPQPHTKKGKQRKYNNRTKRIKPL